ncbi:hypothetical protein SAMN05216480_1033 [Pustulibacterium marinum]|uniref:Uncharacterized protein n=1 Tax=Pustulibacterium marinum TaxID=1224947 RepID=A0A1I7FZT2_9FLAO|nr:hypothetical protein SAMN05216480_1033 [Pustulibacterium marinum]
MKEVFDGTYHLLKWIALHTGFTYREVNIIVYFIIIPMCFVFLIGNIVKKKYLFPCFCVLLAVVLWLIPDFELFSDRLFDSAVAFLNWFERWGLTYVQASVWICVVVPICIMLGLVYVKRYKRLPKH